MEVEKDILNLERNYYIILTTAGQNKLRDKNDNVVLLGLRPHYLGFSYTREYDFTVYFKGGKL